MANVVLRMNVATISQMNTHYKNHITAITPQGGIFSAKVNQCNITAYKSGKVLFQGANAELEANKWSAQQLNSKPASTKKKSTVNSHPYSPPQNIGQMSIIGSDEVGTGDYFGPITVAAVYADQKHIPLLKELGVRDSKI